MAFAHVHLHDELADLYPSPQPRPKKKSKTP
jgi:hypothetical protein